MIIAACQNRNGKPAGILPEQQMQAVVWDIMRADQFLNDYVFSKDTAIDKRKASIKLYRQVFALHKVSAEDFRKSIRYYLQELPRFRVILDSVASRSMAIAGQPKKDTTRKDTTLRPD